MTDHAAQRPAEPVAFTPRGFGIWSEFIDRYGQKVTVHDSSLATEACVWVTPADGQNIHLNQIQATELRDALTAWLSGPEFVDDATFGLTATTTAGPTVAEQRRIDDTPCPTCGGDRLRPDYSKPGPPCHITPTTPNQEQ